MEVLLGEPGDSALLPCPHCPDKGTTNLICALFHGRCFAQRSASGKPPVPMSGGAPHRGGGRLEGWAFFCLLSWRGQPSCWLPPFTDLCFLKLLDDWCKFATGCMQCGELAGAAPIFLGRTRCAPRRAHPPARKLSS